MADMRETEFHPDYAVPPGETLQETLDYIGMSQTELAERTGRPIKTINGIVKGTTSITPDTALQLEKVLGISAGFWSRRERSYQEFKARIKERARHHEWLDWLENIPVKEMIRHGWIDRHADKVDQIWEVLSYFGVVSPAELQNVYR